MEGIEMTKEEIVQVLNDLIRTSSTAEMSFALAAEDALREKLKITLRACSDACHRNVVELQRLVGRLGCIPVAGESGVVPWRQGHGGAAHHHEALAPDPAGAETQSPARYCLKASGADVAEPPAEASRPPAIPRHEALRTAASLAATGAPVRDDRTVLDECEWEEDRAQAAFEAALLHDMPEDIRHEVKRLYAVMLEQHAVIRRLRNLYRTLH